MDEYRMVARVHDAVAGDDLSTETHVQRRVPSSDPGRTPRHHASANQKEETEHDTVQRLLQAQIYYSALQASLSLTINRQRIQLNPWISTRL